MRINKAWSSHLPILIKLLSITDGDVLEMGIGFYSTPFLHWACFEKRKLVSYENNPKYMGYFKSFISDQHNIVFVEDWDNADIERPWDIVFIDHAPSLRRKEEVRRLANWAKYIVVHDTQPNAENKYRYNEIYPLFKYRYNYTKTANHTCILSNFIDVTQFDI